MRLTHATIFIALILLFSVHTPANASWEHDLAVADKLLDSGYYDAAVVDYQKIAITYADQSPASDRAWFGLSRAYHLSANIPAAKLAAEKCLEIGSDEAASTGARELYRTLQSEAHTKKLELEKAYNYYQFEYKRTSWLNIITKFLNYRDLRKVRKQFNAADEYDKTFNPRYLIDPIVIETPVDPVDTTIVDDSAKTKETLNQVMNNSNLAKNIDPEIDTVDESRGVEATVVITEAPKDANTILKESREKYLATYRTLQDALRTQNQQEVQVANSAFQAASKAYKEAQSQVAANQ